VQAAAVVTPGPSPTPTPTPTATPTATPPPVATPSPTPVAKPLVSEPTLTGLTLFGRLRTSKSRLRVRYTLTAAATVRFTVTKRGARSALASWTRRSAAGTSLVTLKRRLPTRRTLRRGTYTLTLRAGASTRTAAFRVG
jgi:hypothetical protein